MQAADHLIDLGPGAGKHGGLVIAEGTVDEVRDNPESITGRYLRGELEIPIPEVRRRMNRGARHPHRGRARAQPAQPRRRDSARTLRRGHRRVGQRQVDADRGHPAPRDVTPLTSLLMAEMLAECGLPAGAFAIATGRGETGAALVDAVDFVMFTGSVETGKKVMAQAAQTLTPVSLELGGKDPMIVLADADLERAANAAVSYGLNNSGQVCISVERIYVEEPVHDEFVDLVTEKVGALRQGPPGEPGPWTSARSSSGPRSS